MASAAAHTVTSVTDTASAHYLTWNQSFAAMNSTITSISPLLSPEELRRVERYLATINAIKHWYMWVIFAFGFPGNLLSLVIILRLRSFGSPALYVAALAVVDNVAIVVKLILIQFGEHKVAIGLSGCKVMFFLGNHLVVYANWVLVTMALERFMAIWQPLRLNRMWTSRKAAISLAVVLLVTVTFTAPLFVTVTVKTRGERQTCVVDPAYKEFMGVWQWAQVTAYGFLPCFLLLTLNILIIVLIARSRRLQLSMTPTFKHCNTTTNSKNSFMGGGVQRQATILLVVTSAVLVLTTTPICVYILIQQWWRPQLGTVEFAQKRLIRFVLRVVCDANHSVNFYLYFISARKFRNYFCKALCWLCLRREDRRGSDPTGRHLSASRSTQRVREKESHVLLKVKADGGAGQNSRSGSTQCSSQL